MRPWVMLAIFFAGYAGSAIAEDATHVNGSLSVGTAADRSSATAEDETRLLREISAAEVATIPVLQHVTSAGATVNDLGSDHGVRAVVARHGSEFMILTVAPDGQAAVSGLSADLSVGQLLQIAKGYVTELGTVHGLRGLFVRDGNQFQVFYATPDGARVIAGVMWDAQGKNLTRDQVSSIEGTVPTVEIGPEKGSPGSSTKSSDGAAAVASALSIVKDTHFGTYGRADAPRLWVFVDPLCSFSIKAMAALDPYVSAGRIQLAVIPVAVLDYENNNRSTPSALAMLSYPTDQMVGAWRGRHLDGPASEKARAALTENMMAATSIGLKGTPTLVWQKKDGSVERIDGVPTDFEAVVSSVGG
jgi:thiol:disulfide interchange protein DsbG